MEAVIKHRRIDEISLLSGWIHFASPSHLDTLHGGEQLGVVTAHCLFQILFSGFFDGQIRLEIKFFFHNFPAKKRKGECTEDSSSLITDFRRRNFDKFFT